MTTHNDLLGPLLEELPNQVFLVAHYEDNRLGLGQDPTLRVFLPDFHWMSRECLVRYTGGYEFNGNRELPNGKPGFATLLNILENLQDAQASLEIFQLGDRFDLWREVTREDILLTAYQRVRNDARVTGLATRLNDLNAKYIRGNHDAWLATLEKGNFTDPPSAPDLETGNGTIFLTHGHRYENWS